MPKDTNIDNLYKISNINHIKYQMQKSKVKNQTPKIKYQILNIKITNIKNQITNIKIKH